MSLHKFADMVAQQGRGDDSLLIHMTPDEVQRLQKFAEANGRSLTINPTTGLPEAGMLSDLFKAIAPIALGAFLGPAGMGLQFGGLSSALSAGIATGGITALATGSLSRGLMAGLGAYGGAGLGEGLMGAATATDAFQAAQSNLGPEANAMSVKDVAATANINPYTTGVQALGTEQGRAAALNAMGGTKGALTTAGMAAAPLMAIQPTTKMPETKSTGYIRQFDYNINPETGRPDPLYGMRAMTPVKASEFGDKTFQGQRDLFRQQNPNPYELGVGSLNQPPQQPARMNTGGIVALAGGGAYESTVNAYSAGEQGTAGVDNPADAIAKIQAAMDRNKALAAQNLATAQAQPATAVDMASNKGTADAGIAALTPAANAAPVTNTGAAGELAFTSNNVGATPNGGLTNLLANVASNVGNAAGAGNAAAPQLTPTQAAAEVNDMYRNVLGRDADPVGMAYWTNQIALGVPLDTLFNNFKTSATSNAEIVNSGFSNAAEAMKDYGGFASTEGGTVGDEWVRNVLGRELNADDRSQQWYRDLLDPKIAKDVDTTKSIYNDFKAYAKSRDPLANTDLNWMAASQLKALPPPVNPTQQATQTVALATDINTAPAAALPVGVGGSTGPSQIGGGATVNPNGTITTSPVIPGIPVGGFTGMKDVRDAYTKGGGSTGYTPQAPKTMAEFELAYNKQTGDSLAAYNYLMGKGGGKYPTKSGVPQIAVPYSEYVLGKKPAAAKPKTTDTAAEVTLTGDQTMPFANLYQSVLQREGDATGLAYWKDRFGDTIDADELAVFKAAAAAEIAARGLKTGATTTKASTATIGGTNYDLTKQSTQPPEDNNGKWDWDAAEKKWVQYGKFASGGMAYAVGGGLGSLGSYSDGGRLLKGPGDGVSDSIPATIGHKQQPARLADGEFVIPARIVSELGNGSTDAGAKKLYAMMDRVQRARGKTTGKNKIAANSRSDKYLPA